MTRASVGTPQAIAAGAGAGWVSVAGGPTESALATSACGDVISGSGTPDVLIASDLPLQGPGSGDPRTVESAIRFMLARHRFKAGDFTVGYQSCDVATPQTGGIEFRKCAANASAYAHAEKLVAVIGPWSSYCGQVQIPILNRAPGGPLAFVSPAATHSGLTRGGPLAPAYFGIRGEPEVYYPRGVRNFFRVVPREDLQGAAQALLAKQLGLKRVYVVYQRFSEWKFHADAFRRAAGRLGLRVVGSAAFDPAARSYDALAGRVAAARAQGVFIGGTVFEGGDRVLRPLRGRLGHEVPIMATDQFTPVSKLLARAGRDARGVYLTMLDVPPAAREDSPAGRRFAHDFGALEAPTQYVLPAAQAADVVLRAIARSDGTRASVLHELRRGTVKDGILGDFRFDRYGDITPAQLPIFRVTGTTPPNANVFEWFDGAVVDRVVRVSPRLSG